MESTQSNQAQNAPITTVTNGTTTTIKLPSINVIIQTGVPSISSTADAACQTEPPGYLEIEEIEEILKELK